jgi:hypothetical protein
MQADVPVRSAEVSAVVIRACARCGGAREIGTRCAKCGNADAPEVTDLGVISATYRSPRRQAWRHIVTDPLARRRIRKASRRTARLNRP